MNKKARTEQLQEWLDRFWRKFDQSQNFEQSSESLWDAIDVLVDFGEEARHSVLSVKSVDLKFAAALEYVIITSLYVKLCNEWPGIDARGRTASCIRSICSELLSVDSTQINVVKAELHRELLLFRECESLTKLNIAELVRTVCFILREFYFAEKRDNLDCLSCTWILSDLIVLQQVLSEEEYFSLRGMLARFCSALILREFNIPLPCLLSDHLFISFCDELDTILALCKELLDSPCGNPEGNKDCYLKDSAVKGNQLTAENAAETILVLLPARLAMFMLDDKGGSKNVPESLEEGSAVGQLLLSVIASPHMKTNGCLQPNLLFPNKIDGDLLFGPQSVSQCLNEILKVVNAYCSYNFPLKRFYLNFEVLTKVINKEVKRIFGRQLRNIDVPIASLLTFGERSITQQEWESAGTLRGMESSAAFASNLSKLQQLELLKKLSDAQNYIKFSGTSNHLFRTW
eukprot:GHVL01009760.1.p1 GENE.GHVL01009760.1~~GHVL01009760.1.p1  ORF type:complete len:460 (+),score=57.62 GHVL01009760.1:53-1432(+)